MKGKMILEYTGDLTFNLISLKLNELDNIMENMNMKLSSQKVLYSIMVESLENIFRHFDMDTDEIINTDNNYQTKFSLNQKSNGVLILKTSNLIWNKNIDKLKEKIELVNSLDKPGLKKLYKTTIREITLKKANSAGLGIIDIAKLSENKIVYNFEKINSKISYFQFEITISNLIYKMN